MKTIERFGLWFPDLADLIEENDQSTGELGDYDIIPYQSDDPIPLDFDSP